MDLILGPESVTIFIKSRLRRRSGIFTHFTLQGAETRRFAKHILLDESPARMTHTEIFPQLAPKPSSIVNIFSFLITDADAKEEHQPVLQIDQKRGSSGLQGLLVDSA